MKEKKLVRPRADRKIAGVCAGLAQYFGIDVTVVRIIFVFLLLPGGAPGFVPYLILWALMPDEESAS